MAEPSPNLIPRSSPEIRVAVAGMGKMGNIHRAALEDLAAGSREKYYKGGVGELLSRLRICGICDTKPLPASNHPDIPRFSSPERMMDEARPHIVIVATPTPTHKSLALAALKRGIHTLVEKPIATRTADLDEILDMAGGSGARLLAGHVERYNPVSVKIRSLLDGEGSVPGRYRFTRTQNHDPRISDDIVVDKVIHDLDLSLHFFGPIASMDLEDCRFRNGRLFEALISIGHRNGTRGGIFVSWLIDDGVKVRRVDINRGGESLRGDFLAKRLWLDGEEIRCAVPGWIEPGNNQIKDELVDFIAYCTEPSSENPPAPLVSLGEIREATAWLEYLVQQASHHSPRPGAM
jgi:UDP-N-acetylglucosamine 3-dehydrogenase